MLAVEKTPQLHSRLGLQACQMPLGLGVDICSDLFSESQVGLHFLMQLVCLNTYLSSSLCLSYYSNLCILLKQFQSI